MPRRGALAVEQDDDLVVRAIARGDRDAIGRLIEAHGDDVYGLLRMALPEVKQVEAAFYETFLKAAQRAGDPRARADTAEWLKSIAFEEIADRAVPTPPVPLHGEREPARRPVPGDGLADLVDENDAQLLAGVTDKALAVLVRTLEPRARQALVLSFNCELDATRTAAIIGCRPEEVASLRAAAIDGLRERLAEHERREAALRRQMAPRTPHHLRPMHTLPSGMTVVKGHKVYVEAAPNNVFMLIARIVRKVMARLVRADLSKLEDDDVGGGSKLTKTPETTPTAQPFERPKLTPSLKGYRTPKLSSGTVTYRNPKATPSTQRISSPGRTAAASGTAWSSARLWRR